MLELNKLYNMDCMQGMKEFPILAAHRAALKKNDKPYARTVHRAKCF